MKRIVGVERIIEGKLFDDSTVFVELETTTQEEREALGVAFYRCFHPSKEELEEKFAQIMPTLRAFIHYSNGEYYVYFNYLEGEEMIHRFYCIADKKVVYELTADAHEEIFSFFTEMFSREPRVKNLEEYVSEFE